MTFTQDFLPPLHPTGSAFRQSVWRMLFQVPYGKTTTYGEIARQLAGRNGHHQMSAQAVGGAVGHNEISIIIVSCKVMEILTRPSTKENVDRLTALFAGELPKIQEKHKAFLTEIRQCGVIMGLKTSHPMGGMALMAALLQNGVWAVYADYDKGALQFKPGLLMPQETAEKVLVILDQALGAAEQMTKSGKEL